MHTISHLAGGAGLAIGFSYSNIEFAFVVGALIGSKAPDFLELPVRLFQSIRIGVVPHRTITHWVGAWFVSCVLVLLIAEQGSLKLLLIGFFAGGLVHLLQDACTPMGVPVFLPFEKRFSVRLVKGWFTEFFINLALMPLFFVTGYWLSKLTLNHV